MAEINVSTQKATGHRQKKLSTRVDLTPMVDLGFLLITFFIFTASMRQPKSMKLNLPQDEIVNLNTTSAGKTLNIILLGGNRIAYYMGANPSPIRYTDYGSEGIRKVIIDVRKNIAKKYGDPKELVVLIKPSQGSNYGNIVQLMDEMLINEVKRYVLMEPAETEINSIRLYS